MPKSFCRLAAQEQSLIYRALAPQLARTPVVLEKDAWVCWVLQTLFTMPERLPMAFKGGTSLSKVFGAIARFSEDVDVTLDYRGLNDSFDPFGEGVSRSQLKKFGEGLKSFVREHVHSAVLPHVQKALASQFDAAAFRLEVSDDGEKMRVFYPTVLDAPAGSYIGSSVLIEFGGRNITEPNEEHVVQPDIVGYVAGLEFPRSTVSVLSPARTFWEKATLIHVVCQRDEFSAGAERLSRHWYDLAMLADQDFGRRAVADRALLADVVRHKKVFFNSSYANYDACLAGQLKLIPSAGVLEALRDDFRRMVSAGMFIGEPPAFEVIIDRLRTLESVINERGAD